MPNKTIPVLALAVGLPCTILLAAHAAPAGHPAGHPAHWTYEGASGPSHWGALEPAFATCGAGKQQSPIDLANASSKDLADPELHYQPSMIHILNNGHTVQLNYDKGSFIEVDGQRYDVVQFHYHAPSEHHVDGKSFPAELHVVHKNAAGKLAVIGILLEEGAENPAYQAFLSNLPAHEAKEQAKDAKIDLAAMLPAVHATYRYDGSLTTPPCTEGVSWFVMETPVALSSAQIGTLKKVFTGNNRPVQPLNARVVTEDTTP